MFRAETKEATPILQNALAALLKAVPTRGRSGSDLRTACGNLSANAEILIATDLVGPPLVNCFDLAITAGATHNHFAYVRSKTLVENPVTIGATLVKNSIINLSLAYECDAIGGMTFVSREDVDQLKLAMNAVFNDAEEVAADDMDQESYRVLVELHAALMFHLIETARPLPRMLRFRFAAPMATLVTAQRLYYDASRADELREENKVVHPAFMLPTGRALSA